MKHIIHKHDSYCIVKPNLVGSKYFLIYTNGDFLDNAYEVKDGVMPTIEGYEEVELQVLYDNFNKSKGR